MYITIKGKQLYWEKAGKGKPLIMIHGNGGDHRGFRKSISILKQKFTVYTLDLPGHGKSEGIKAYSYRDLASYIEEFIKKIGIKCPIFYGFSDGGIMGLLLASKKPQLFSKLIVSGVNVKPDGLKALTRLRMRIMYGITKSKRIKMMLDEPNISKDELSRISIPVFLTRGEHDIVSKDHTEEIAKNIPKSRLTVFSNHFHGSYVVFSKAIGKYILKILKD